MIAARTSERPSVRFLSKAIATLSKYKVGSPFKSITVSVAGSPESAAGNKYNVVVMDYLNKWIEVYALPNHED